MAAGQDDNGGRPAGDVAAGEAEFAGTCQGCHDVPDGLAALAAGDTIAEREDWLWGFLADHFAPEPAARADIIAYLVTFLDDEAVPEGDAEAGEMAYARTCVECHVSGVRVMQGVPGEDADGRAAWLWSFLAGHHAPDETRRSDIISYLLGL